MSDWTAINANQLLPSALLAAVQGSANALTGLLSGRADLNLPTPSASLPSINAAEAVVNAILATMSKILIGGRIHMLTVPIVKTIPTAPPSQLPPTLTDLQNALDITLGPANTEAADTYANIINKRGGNAGFYNAFAASLMDPFDPNRPQYFNQTDAVAMAVLLVGAPRYASITSAAATLDLLTAPKSGNGLMARTVPIPQNATAKIVTMTAAPGTGVKVSWDAPQNPYTSPYFPGVSSTVTTYAVIRSTSPSATRARTVLDFFTTQDLKKGMTNGETTVLFVSTSADSTYLDETAPLNPAKPLYYFVAWQATVAEAGVTSTLPFDRLSNFAKVVVESPTPAPTPSQTGRSPDWVATGVSINIFPVIAKAATSLISQVRTVYKTPGGPSGRLDVALRLAQGSADRLSARATELLHDVQSLATALARPIPSLYITQMSSGTGGNAFLLAELARRLEDTADASRPPFDSGEYVCGVCFVAGAPRLADLANALAFFSVLFGPAHASNPLMGLLASIDTLVTQAEVAVFQPDMTPFPPGSPEAQTVDPLTGAAPVVATPVIADTGTPVATDSPQNPNAGFTNIVPTSELC